MECDITNIKINIVSGLLAECMYINNDTLFCQTAESVQYHHNSSGVLTITTPFNHTIYAGNTLWVNSTCFNSSSVHENILLKPCLSGFHTMAYHNNTHVTISCEHTSFRFSNHGIRIVGENDLAHCSWNKGNQTNNCHGDAEALANGVKYTSLYTRGMNITCKFDGQSVDIAPQQQTTMQTTNMTPSTTKTPLSSTSSQSHENGSRSPDNGQTKVICPVSIISILCILYFIHRDIFI
ncbi:uncharacterized protein LOC133198580 [Saccostrea echinata]|uniref:uncharacterized protein LOC133198580 n=1 Tax=Saccostrea echinata TaxID=191078 RepID=UPI002A807A3F|nr:uncharacterized protein LOC133198580 [Saccostrea echinata]